jgi:hypothetical protein
MRRTVESMLKLIIALLVIWAVLSFAGFLIKGLLWLAVIAIVLFVATSIWGVVTHRGSSTKA